MSEASFADLLLSHDDLLLSDQATLAQEAGRDDIALDSLRDAAPFLRRHVQGLPIHAALLLHAAPLQNQTAGQERQVRKAPLAVRWLFRERSLLNKNPAVTFFFSLSDVGR